MKTELSLADSSGRISRLGRFPAVIGRGDDVDLRLPNILASRRHCEIVLEHSQFVLRDLGSVNGTLLNSEPVTEQVLQDGDQITIGASEMTVVSTRFSNEAQNQNPFKNLSERLIHLVRS